jgi:uncharacterized protein YkwD
LSALVSAVLLIVGILPAAAAPLPRVSISFVASRLSIRAGQCINLAWNVYGAQSVTLQGETVKLQGYRRECPAQTTIYTLVASATTGDSAKRALTVKVAGTPQPSNNPVPSTPPAVPTSNGPEATMLALVNQRRAAINVPQLTINPQLTAAAQRAANDMAAHNVLSHTGSDNSSPGDRAHQAGYNWTAVGENVAQNWAVDANEIFNMWMNSPGHKANIENGMFTEMGFGVATAANGAVYSSLVLGRR